MISLSESLQYIQPIFEASYTDTKTPIEAKDIVDVLGNLWNVVEPFFNKCGIDVVKVGSDKKLIKIPRDKKATIMQYAKNYHITIDKDSLLYNGQKFALIGDGSTGEQVTTHDQEAATAQLWNIKIKDGLDTDDVVDEYLKYDDKNQSWRKSCQAQIEIIQQFLEHHGIKDVNQYRACIYDGENLVTGESTVGKSYSKFVKRYAKLVRKTSGDSTYSKSNKHQFDPSDIILYKLGCNIGPTLDTLAKDGSNHADVIKTYRELYEGKLLFGLSLKKITGGKGTYHEFNINPNARQKITINNVTYEPNKNEGVLTVTGNFGFINTPDPDDPEKNATMHKLFITCRNFKPVAIDVKEPGRPPIGKIEKSKWVSLLEISNGTDLKEVIDALGVLQDLTNEHKEKIKELIQSAIKDGPYCLPFTLIH